MNQKGEPNKKRFQGQIQNFELSDTIWRFSYFLISSIEYNLDKWQQSIQGWNSSVYSQSERCFRFMWALRAMRELYLRLQPETVQTLSFLKQVFCSQVFLTFSIYSSNSLLMIEEMASDRCDFTFYSWLRRLSISLISLSSRFIISTILALSYYRLLRFMAIYPGKEAQGLAQRLLQLQLWKGIIYAQLIILSLYVKKEFKQMQIFLINFTLNSLLPDSDLLNYCNCVPKILKMITAVQQNENVLQQTLSTANKRGWFKSVLES